MDLIEELRWRGMIHDMMPGVEEQLQKEKTTGYIGFDPTADSLHIGSLVQIMLLVHLQRAGHKPLALVGGATGMVGDPSGKSKERNLLDEATINRNVEGIKRQLGQFLDFEAKENGAEIVNNYDWFKSMDFLAFIRDVGKHITISYMMAKDSVKNRLESGISFAEFSYQLIQGYDFFWLYKNKNCKLQMGGSDQWGNIVTGTELIRRKDGGEAFAVTSPLVTKADGSKFGKTEEGNVWLDPEKTSPYKFYQFWLNATDEDAQNWIKIFTLLSKEEVEGLLEAHHKAPHQRALQKALAEEVTVKVHGRAAYDTAVLASQILFGKSTREELQRLSERALLEIFEGVPQHQVPKTVIESGTGLIEFLADHTAILPSRGEARRMIKENAISINKEKAGPDYTVTANDLLNGQYILVQRGKKNYYLVKGV